MVADMFCAGTQTLPYPYETCDLTTYTTLSLRIRKPPQEPCNCSARHNTDKIHVAYCRASRAAPSSGHDDFPCTIATTLSGNDSAVSWRFSSLLPSSLDVTLTSKK